MGQALELPGRRGELGRAEGHPSLEKVVRLGELALAHHEPASHPGQRTRESFQVAGAPTQRNVSIGLPGVDSLGGFQHGHQRPTEPARELPCEHHRRGGHAPAGQPHRALSLCDRCQRLVDGLADDDAPTKVRDGRAGMHRRGDGEIAVPVVPQPHGGRLGRMGSRDRAMDVGTARSVNDPALAVEDVGEGAGVPGVLAAHGRDHVARPPPVGVDAQYACRGSRPVAQRSGEVDQPQRLAVRGGRQSLRQQFRRVDITHVRFLFGTDEPGPRRHVGSDQQIVRRALHGSLGVDHADPDVVAAPFTEPIDLRPPAHRVEPHPLRFVRLREEGDLSHPLVQALGEERRGAPRHGMQRISAFSQRLLGQHSAEHVREEGERGQRQGAEEEGRLDPEAAHRRHVLMRAGVRPLGSSTMRRRRPGLGSRHRSDNFAGMLLGGPPG